MNVERIDQVIASIKGEVAQTQELGFCMAVFAKMVNRWDKDMSGRNCGTIACIAGHAYVLSKGTLNLHEMFIHRAPMIAAKWLGINGEIAERLFFPEGTDRVLESITAQEAIAVLENLKVTGTMDWSIING